MSYGIRGPGQFDFSLGDLLRNGSQSTHFSPQDILSELLEIEGPWNPLSESQYRRLSETFGSETLRELQSLAQERNPDLFFESLLQLGQRLERATRLEAAARLYHGIASASSAAEQAQPCAALQARARARLAAMQGDSHGSERAEYLLRSLTSQATDPVGIFAMGVAGAAFRITRLAMLPSLVAAPRAGLLTRLLGASPLASLMGFAVEAPAFTIASRLGNEALGRRQDWSQAALGHDLASSFLVLGGLKLGGWASGAAYRGLASSAGNPGHGILPFLFQQGGMLTGILLGHGLEQSLNLRPRQNGGALLMDSLATLMQLNIAGRLMQHSFGPTLGAWERSLDLRSEALRRHESLGFPPTPEFGSGLELAFAGAAASRGRAIDTPALPNTFAMSMEGDGSGSGLRLLPSRPSRILPGERMERIFREFAEHAERTSSRPLRTLLRALGYLRDSISDRQAAEEIQDLLNVSVNALHDSIRDTPGLAAADRAQLASALAVLGEYALRLPEARAQVQSLFQAGADLAAASEASPSPERFLQDRVLAASLGSLRGRLEAETLNPERAEALARVWIRMGIASGARTWAQQEHLVPGLDPSLQSHLGVSLQDVSTLELSPAQVYLESAAAWRPGPLSESDLIFERFLRPENTNQPSPPSSDSISPVVAHLRNLSRVSPLGNEARATLFQEMIEAAEITLDSHSEYASLYRFLREASRPSTSPGSGSRVGTSQIDMENLVMEIPPETRDAATVRVFADERIPVHPTALRQARGMAALPGAVHALGMPDIHAGQTVPNGFVLATEGTVVPGAVGRDINCGMRLYRTGLNRNEVDWGRLLREIAARIRLGERRGPLTLEESDVEAVLSRGIAGLASASAATRARHPVWEMLDEPFLAAEAARIEEGGALPGDALAVARGHRQIGRSQLGTLGDGNHFMEFQVVDDILHEGVARYLGISRGEVLMMVHSGSRGLGHSVGTQYMQIAKSLARGSRTPVRDIYTLEVDSPEGQRYMAAMNAAANYAFANRLLLGAIATQAIGQAHSNARMELIYDVAHNIVKVEEHQGRRLHVHRKGATRAFPPSRMAGTPFSEIGQPVLIPGSMGTASYLLVGNEGSEASLHSVNHGAGRVMTRAEALRAPEERRREADFEENRERLVQPISDRDFQRAMRGIELVYHDGRTIKGEAPQVYKDIDEVMRVVFGAGLATGVARLRPIGVIKE